LRWRSSASRTARLTAAISPASRTFPAFRGQLLAADEAPTVEEGSWPYHKVILMSFPDERALRAFADSPEYRAIAVDRWAGTDGVVLIVHGLT
jgi:uncharacterized protein (DUF1330 family)